MSKTFSEFETAVRSDLNDAGEATWTDAEIARAIRKALFAYSHVKPAEAIGTIALQDDGREISLSTLTGLIDVHRVWWPYEADKPGYPPRWVRFQLWDDNATLFIDEKSEPQSGDVVRVFYTKLHTINGLDGENVTTVPTEDEELIILGATAYAAIQKTRKVIDQINVSERTPARWSQWGMRRLSEFRRALARLASDMKHDYDARVAVDWEA